MTKLQKRAASAIASGAMLLNVALPVLASTTIEISGNGVFSENVGSVTQNTTTVVNQDNKAFVSNDINVNADTGGNKASFNTGGDTTIKTGDAMSVISVSNDLNTNAAAVDCCEAGDVDVLIQGNGAFSENNAHIVQNNVVTVDQDNSAFVINKVNSNLNTGDNKASFNTGADVTILTGNALSDVSVSTKANTNIAMVGGGSSLMPGSPSVSLRILDNGAFSKNDLTAYLTKSVDLDQENKAIVKNFVNADANTGGNKASFNNGDVVIKTGGAGSIVDVDNMVNFNYAAVDCGCTWDVLAKIAGNGAKSKNTAWLALNSIQLYDQDNFAKLFNKVDADAETGDNSAKFNGGGPLADPWIVTGDSVNIVGVSNSGNENIIGGPLTLPLPWWLGGHTSVEFSASFIALMAYFGLFVS